MPPVIEQSARLAGLSPQKRELLLRQLRQIQGEAPRLAISPRQERLGDFPLSYAQQRLWFLDQLEPGNPFYNLPGGFRLVGPLDEAALGRALSEIVRRHEMLRTTFPSVDGRPVQRVAPPNEAVLPVIDLAGLPEAERPAAVRTHIAAEVWRPFDLAAGPLLRFLLLRLGPTERVLAFALHHIVSDAWSMRVLVRELTALYEAFSRAAPSPLPELPVQYADFAIAQRRWLEGEALDLQLAAWRRRLVGLPGALELPADRPRPEVQTFRGSRQTLDIPASVLASLKNAGQAERATPFMALLAGFLVLLQRYTGREDLVVGTPIANRDRMETEGLIGFFVNTLVLRGDLAGDPGFRDLLARVRETTLEAFAHADLPFERLVEELQPDRNLAHSPIFQVLFAFQSIPVAAATPANLRLEALPVEAGKSLFDLTLSLDEAQGRIAGFFEYNTELFDAVRIQRMAGHFEALLGAAARDPERRLSELPLLTPAERHQLAAEWTDTARARTWSRRVHELFEAQAARTPDAPAVLCGDETASYREINARANRLARILCAGGARPGVRVGVCLERSIDLPAALLAVWKTGAAYVPMDPAYPEDRLAFMLTDSGAEVLLAGPRIPESLADLVGTVIRPERISGTGQDSGADEAGEADLGLPGDDLDLAYVIYTSGSTGRPKGVAITHASAAAMLEWASEVFPPDDLAGVLASTSICFDLSIFELFLPLVTGGAVVLAENALELPRLPAASSVTLVNTVPSAMAELLRTGSVPPSVRTVNLAGEPLRRGLADQVHAAGVGRLFNLYGPSEDTTYSTVLLVDRAGGPPTIGRPIAGTRAYVVDPGARLLPVGVPGELWLGGAGLAQRYLGRPDLTAEKFVPDLFGELSGDCGDRGDGGRLYRTGDLARWSSRGELEFLGRIDHQVKVRGFRIELGEIEAALLSYPDIRDAAVLVREIQASDLQLVAYVVGQGNPAPAVADLKARLRARLPEHMVPALFVLLPALPLTPNGKTDRQALAALRPQSASPAAAWTPPRTLTEEILAGIWERILETGQVGAHDSFFDLGGHSLLATRMISRVREAFAVELPLRALFAAPTVAGLAAAVEAARSAGGGAAAAAAPPIVRQPRDGRLPLSFGQQRLWFLDQLEPGSAAYNMPWAVRMEGRLDPGALAGSLSEVVCRHEALRTVFQLPEGEDEPEQRILPARPVPLPLVDLGSLSREARQAAARHLATLEARRPFELSRGPLLRPILLRLAGEEHVLLLTLHHVAGDGWSMSVLMNELAALYGAGAAGRPSPLAELPVQYADYAAWQRAWLTGNVLAAQLSFWRAALAGVPSLLDLPTDRPRPALQTFRGARRAAVLPTGLAEGVRELGRSRGTTGFMVVLAALQILLHRLSGQPVVAVGSPIANRGRGEIEGLIGFFANTLVLAVDLAGEPSFQDLLDRVREVALGAYAHQDLPFEKLVEELAPERHLAHAPLFQVLLSFQSTGGPMAGPIAGPLGAQAAGGLTLSPIEADMAAAKFDLTLAVEERRTALAVGLDYNTDLFDPATAGRLLEQFRALLEAGLAAPQERISALQLLDAAQRAQLLVEWNDTASLIPSWDCLHELAAEQACRAPDAVAVFAPEGILTRGELARRSAQLAAQLLVLGVGPEVLVGVCMERSLGLVVGLLGILEAGGAYLPLDPSYPRERLDFMLADAGAPVVLTTQKTLGRLGVEEHPPGQTPAGPRWICLDRDRPGTTARPTPPSGVRPDHLAYVLYTSGSTGRPKGVALAHRGAAALLRWASRVFPESDRDGVLASTSICFDLSVFELFLPLCCGGAVVLAESALHLPRLADACRVTLVNTVPSAIAELVRGEELPPSVRTVALAGEPLPRRLVDEIHGVPTVERVLNLYGPSEDTTYSTFATIERSDRDGGRDGGLPPIGRPVGEGRSYLLDARLRPVPLGVPGELFLAGAGLARGYLKRPGLTAEKFVPDPFSAEPGARLYRTGDLVRFRPDGELLFLGRLDHQVKVRGFRIELGEIEATLCRHPDVAEAAAVAVGEPGSGDLRLVAYVVGKEGPAPSIPSTPPTPPIDELRGFLRTQLPGHMVPWAFVSLPALPRNANGKIDRRALPDPGRTAWGGPAELAEPRSEMEQRIAAIWRELLRLDQVGIHDNFFDSGGHSLLALRAYHRLKRDLARDFPLVALFEHPTIGALARYLEAGEAAPATRQAGEDRGARRREVLAARRRPGRPTADAGTADES
jgi:amino acid adenylation domain-containing protein